jgi:predicted GNAT family N-acyltransferase
MRENGVARPSTSGEQLFVPTSVNDHRGLRIRPAASPADLHRLGRLRYDVYVAEMKMHYGGVDHESRMLIDRLDWASVNLLAETGGSLVGGVRASWGSHAATLATYTRIFPLRPFLRVADPDELSFCSRLAVAREWRRRPRVLYQLLTAVYLEGRQRHCRFNLVHCAPRLEPLFAHLGYIRFSSNVWEPMSGSEQVPMALALEDRAYLLATGSCLAGAAAGWPESTSAGAWLRELGAVYA